MNKRTLKKLEKIALETSMSLQDRGGIDTRNSDGWDFWEIAIWDIEEMLVKAYELGRADGRKEGK